MALTRKPRYPRTGSMDHAGADQAISLADEHAELLKQVAVRAGDLLAEAAASHWPGRELEALAGYLRAEILRQAADEETLLFPSRGAGPGLIWLARDHARLRAGVDTLERSGHGSRRSPARLASVTRDLLCQLERHLTAEETALARPGGLRSAPATTALGAHPHEWYPLTEGPAIDLDVLPPGQAADAAAERVLRLGRGETVELACSSDPYPVWRQVDGLAPRHYGFAYLEDGPAHWRVLVTRRELP